jgi:hypothetical protein
MSEHSATETAKFKKITPRPKPRAKKNLMKNLPAARKAARAMGVPKTPPK